MLSRTRMAALLAEQPACVLAMEACATSPHRGRVAQRHGHEARLVPALKLVPRAAVEPGKNTLREAGGEVSFVRARTANEVLKAQTARVRLSKMNGELVDRARATTHPS